MNELSLANGEIDKLLAEKLTDKEHLANLIALLDKIGEINFFLSMLESFIYRSPVILENINRTLIELREHTKGQETPVFDISLMIEVAKKLNEILNSEDIQLMASAAYSALKTYDPEKQAVGMVGIVRCLSDKDIQKSIGLIFHILREIGKTLNYSK